MRSCNLFFTPLAAAIMGLSLPVRASAAERLCPLGGIQQLRIYEIFERNKPAFHARFRDHATRIMKRYGFDVVAMWETKQSDRTEFVYLLQWPDEATMKRQWNAFFGRQGMVEDQEGMGRSPRSGGRRHSGSHAEAH